MMRVMIVDDEPLARERLRRLCLALGGIEIVAEAADGKQALQEAARVQPEVVLLDVRMPVMSGIEVAQHLAQQEPAPAVIFTTAYDDYALQAFKVQAVDYLLKPIASDALQAALQQAARPNRMQLQALHSGTEVAKKTGRSHISARVRGNLVLIPLHEIYYFHADQKYVTVRHQHGEVLIEDALKDLEEEFGPGFVRVHRNALICLNRIAGVERDALGRTLITLRGIPDKVEVSRRHLAELRLTLKHL